MTRHHRALFVLTLAISACDVFGPEGARIATVEILATDDTLSLRTLSTTLTAVARDAQGSALTDADLGSRQVTWESASPSLTLESSGMTSIARWNVSSNAELETHPIRVLVDGVAGETQLTICPAVQLSSMISQTLVVGRSVTLMGELPKLTGNAISIPTPLDVPIGWRSTNIGVISITPGGVATAVAVGEESIVATACGFTESLLVSVVPAGYTLTFLGEGTNARKLNENAQVAGSGGGIANWLWSGGTRTDIGSCSPGGLSDAGDVLCFAAGPTIWSNGATSVRDTFSANGVAMNSTGQVLMATSQTTTRWDGPGQYVPGGYFASVADLNNRGDAIGRDAFLYPHGLLWHNASTRSLGGFGRYTTPSAINDAVNIAGSTEFMSTYGGGVVAVIWLASATWAPYTLRPTGFPGVPNRVATAATDINNNGQVVGSGIAGAFLWENGRLSLLSHLLADGNWVITSAAAINDKGQIIGQARNTVTGANGAVLLSPP